MVWARPVLSHCYRETPSCAGRLRAQTLQRTYPALRAGFPTQPPLAPEMAALLVRAAHYKALLYVMGQPRQAYRWKGTYLHHMSSQDAHITSQGVHRATRGQRCGWPRKGMCQADNMWNHESSNSVVCVCKYSRVNSGLRQEPLRVNVPAHTNTHTHVYAVLVHSAHKCA